MSSLQAASPWRGHADPPLHAQDVPTAATTAGREDPSQPDIAAPQRASWNSGRSAPPEGSAGRRRDQGRDRQLAARFWRDSLRRYRRRLVLAIGLMMVAAGTTGLYPLLIQWTFTQLEQRSLEGLWLVPALVLAVTAAKALTFYLQVVVSNALVLRVLNDIQIRLFSHLVDADMARLMREPTGTLISRFTNDIAVVRKALSRIVSNFGRDVLTVFSLGAAMLYLDWLLSLIVLVIYPLAAWPIVLIGRRMRRQSKLSQAHVGEMTQLLSESLAGIRMVKTYGLEDYEKQRAQRKFEGLYQLLFRLAENRARLDPVLEILGGVAVAGVIAFGTWRMTTTEGAIGDFIGFVTALLMAAQPVRAIGTLNAVLQEGLGALDRVYEVLDEPPRIISRPAAPPLRVTRGAIALNEVTFRYGGTAPALSQVSFRIEPGQTVALVGRSGAGKSTVFNLLARLFDPDQGEVLIDSQNVSHYDLTTVRAAFSLVSQDVVLFDDTVAANIGFGRLGATQAEIEAAARAAAADDFVRRLPAGYHTPVGDRGARLSGGERQRIALARAFLRDAPILLLDEATSALDAESERLVQEALAALGRGRTTLVIAHRLATVRRADSILVLDRGRLVEQGTHDQLVARGGVYATLARLQFRDAA